MIRLSYQFVPYFITTACQSKAFFAPASPFREKNVIIKRERPAPGRFFNQNPRKKDGLPLMENLIVSASVVLPLFFMIALGYFVKRIRMVDDPSLQVMNNLTFRVFLPVLLFYNIYKTDVGTALNNTLMAFAAVSVTVSFFVLLLLIPRIEKANPRRGVLIQGIFRSNFIIFGLPVTESLFGPGAAGTASLLIAVIIPLFNALSVVALELFRGGKMNPKKILKGIVTNPLILASALGVLAMVTGFRFPAVLEEVVADVGGIATPLALIILGASFSFSAVKGHGKQLLLGLGGRLVLIPAIFLPIGIALGFRGPELAVLIALFASPTAVSSFTMAQQMDGDAQLAGQLVVFGSLFSILTIFLWVFSFKQLGLL